jgi:hypothetical protein
MSASINFKLSLYADDSALIASGVNVDDIGKCLSGELATCGE